MSPDRKAVINGKTIAEYYWAGEMVVYIDNRLSGMTFDLACEQARAAEAARAQVQG